jgi:hypothetical protein
VDSLRPIAVAVGRQMTRKISPEGLRPDHRQLVAA